VICSGVEPLPEVAGKAAILCGADDHAAFGHAVLEVSASTQRRDALVQAGLENAAGYGRQLMISRFVTLYEEVARTRALGPSSGSGYAASRA
jgi:hypothetical protein